MTDELDRLSENHRLALVLCDLEGLSRADAAERLGWNEGTLSARLHRGRKELGERLRARGVNASLVVLAAVFATTTAVSARAIKAAVALAGVVTESGLTDRAVPPAVAALVSHTTQEIAMRITTKVLAAVVLTAGLIGFGWLGLPGGGEPRASAAPVPEAKKDEKVELPTAAVPLLHNRKVLKELKCTPEQRVTIEDHLDDLQDAQRDAQKQLQAQIDGVMKANGGKPNAQAERVMVQAQAQRVQQQADDLQKTVEMAKKVLKPDQLRRLVQIDLQVRWAELFTDAKTQDELGLTADQKKQIAELLDTAKGDFKQQQFVAPGGANGVVFTTQPPGGNPRFAKVQEMLTESQVKAWKKMAGEPVDFEKLILSESQSVYRVTLQQNVAVPLVPQLVPRGGK